MYLTPKIHEKKTARAKELEAWPEKYPYNPPQEGLTNLTISLRTGSWQGRKRSKPSLKRLVA